MLFSKIIAVLAVAVFTLFPSYTVEAAPSVSSAQVTTGTPSLASWWQSLTAFFLGRLGDEAPTEQPVRSLTKDTARLEPGGVAQTPPPDGSGGTTSIGSGGGTTGSI